MASVRSRVAAAVLAAGGTTAARVGTPAPAAASACGPDPFTAQIRAHLAAPARRHAISAAVYEVTSGCRYDLNPGAVTTTASLVKIQIGAAVLLRAQRQGRGLTASEHGRLRRMITRSENPPTTSLWSSLGGRAGMVRAGRDLTMARTAPVAPWGLTRTTADDQVHLLRQVVLGEGGPLDPAHRQPLVDAMRDVVPGQRWGVSAGAPAGSDVVLKNGFYPARRLGWRVTTAGVVTHPSGRRFAVAILSHGWPTMQDGINAVEYVGWAVNRDGDMTGFTPRKGSPPP